MPLRPAATTHVGLFTVGVRLFAVESAWVRQVVSVPSVTPVPRTGPELLGLFAERGQVVPLLSLSLLLGTTETDAQDSFQDSAFQDLALMVQSGEHLFALAIDRMVGFEALEVAPGAAPQAFSTKSLAYRGETVPLLALDQLVAAFHAASLSQ